MIINKKTKSLSCNCRSYTSLLKYRGILNILHALISPTFLVMVAQRKGDRDTGSNPVVVPYVELDLKSLITGT